MSYITGEFYTSANTVFDLRILPFLLQELFVNISQALLLCGTHFGKSDVKVNSMQAASVCFPEVKCVILAELFLLFGSQFPYFKGAIDRVKDQKLSFPVFCHSVC